MLNKNKKIIIGGIVVFILIGTILLIGMDPRFRGDRVQDGAIGQLGEVRQAANLDEYIETDPGLMHKKNIESLQLPKKEIAPPIPTQIELRKITMTPISVVGGDAIYTAIGELPGNKFFRLEPDNLDKIFSVRSPEEALKYIDFLMITAGRSSYARARRTVWQAGDYDRIGCKDVANNQNLSLPNDRPVSQAKISGDGFEVTWIYFTPTVPAGYHKMVLQVEKNGGFTIEDSPDEPFWPCGQGFVF